MDRVYLYIAVMAITTYLIRMLPLVFFKKKIENRFVQSFLYYVPYACLTAMTFPAILYATESILSGLIGLLVAIFFAYKNFSMVKVAIFSCVAVYLCEFVMRLI